MSRVSRYSDYEKKLAPWVKAKNFVRRHRILLIALASASACVAIALASTKGIVSEEVVVKDTLTYGDVLSYGASAFLGKASYEFSPADEDNWTSAIPKLVGEYKMRAKADNSFGGAYYGEVHYFTIEPFKTTCSIPLTSYTYGTTPGISIELTGGDKVASYEIAYDDLSKEKPLAKVDKLRIEDSSGADVTANYEIDGAVSTPVEVTLKPVSLALAFSSSSWVYDGASHSLGEDEYELKGSLVEGDRLSFEKDTIIAAGEKEAVKSGSVKILREENGKETDVTCHYSIDVSYGSLSVLKAPVSIESASKSKVYDGSPFSKSEYESCEILGLIGEDAINVDYGDQSSNIFPGEYENIFSYSFASVEAEGNYEVDTPVFGTLEIKKRHLTVEIAGEHRYEGSKFAGTLPSSEVSAPNLAPGDTIECYVESEESCLGGKPSVMCKISNEAGQDVTSCYEITLDSKKLTYLKRELTVEAKEVSEMYDGKSHSGSFSYEGLVNGEHLEYKSEPYSGVEVTSLDYAPEVNRIYVSGDEGDDRTAYYDISCKKAKFEIYKRPITVTLHVDRSYSDDGTSIEGELALSEEKIEYAIGGEGLVEGHRLLIEPKNIYTAPEFTYTIYDADNKDVTKNYEIQKDESDVSFKQSSLLVDNLSLETTYDGKYHQVSPTFRGLKEGDSVKWKSDPERQFMAGEYTPTLEIESIVNSKSEDVTKHYSFLPSYTARLKINAASPVTVTLTISGSYGGSDFAPSEANGDFTVDGLQDGDTAKVTLNKDPFLYPDSTDFEVSITHDSPKADVTSCYQSITKENANNITWEKGPLTVEAFEKSVVYNGSAASAQVKVSGLATYDRVSFTCNGTKYSNRANGNISISLGKSDIGDYPVEVSEVSVKHLSGGDASAYYSSIEGKSSFVHITARPLQIKLRQHGSEKKDYEVVDLGSSDSGLATGQSIRLRFSAVDADYVDYYPSVVNSAGKDVTSNYAFSLEGTSKDHLTFARIPLTVSYADTTAVYDGELHLGEVEVNTTTPDYCNVGKESSKYTVELTEDPKDKEKYGKRYAGDSVTFVPTVKAITDSGVDETDLFKVTTSSGTLSITKRPLTIVIKGSMTYNGSLFSNRTLSKGLNEASLDSGYDYYVVDGTYNGVESLGLASTDSISISPKDDGKGTIIGNKTNEDWFDISIKCGNEERKGNYDITVEADYTFNKGEVSISTSGGSYTYSGNEYQGTAKAYAYGSDTAKATASEESKQTEAGHYEYEVTVVSVSSSKGEDRTPYYNLKTETASFDINKRSVRVKFKDITVFATGKPFDYDEYWGEMTPTVTGLPSGYEIKSEDYAFPTGPSEVGTYSFATGYEYQPSVKIVNASGEDKTSNFNVSFSGTITIQERLDLAVSFLANTKVYDGKPFSATDLVWVTDPTTIPLGCTLVYETKREVPSEAGVGTYSLEEPIEESCFYIKRKNGKRLLKDCYTLTFANQPSFSITPCKIEFTTPDIYDWYDGESFEIGCGSATPNVSLKKKSSNVFSGNGDTITLKPSHETYEITGPGTFSNGSEEEPWTYEITDGEGLDAKANYEITFKYGTITIEEC